MTAVSTWISVSILVLSLLFSALFSGAEASFYALRCESVEKLGRKKSKRLSRLLQEPGESWAALLLFARLSQAAVVVMSVVLLKPFLGNLAYGAVPFIYVLMAFAGDYIPKLLVLRYAEDFALYMAGPLSFFVQVGSPVCRWWRRGIEWFLALHAPWEHETPGDEEGDSIFLQEERERVSRVRQQEMLGNLAEFGETKASEIMTPRTEIFALEVSERIIDVLPKVKENLFSRIPVYKEHIDNIVGILYAKDLLAYHRQPTGGDLPIKALLHPPFFVPDSKKVDELLREFQRNKMHLAIVVDEYGGVAGLVTLEDVLEELVGEIIDEYDQQETLVRTSPDNDGYIVSGRLSLADFNSIMHTTLPEEDFDTIGGYVFHQFGRVPQVGETVVDKEWIFTIEAAEGPKILEIRVRKRAANGQTFASG